MWEWLRTTDKLVVENEDYEAMCSLQMCVGV